MKSTAILFAVGLLAGCSSGSAPPPPPPSSVLSSTPLPPWLSYCDASPCTRIESVVVHRCLSLLPCQPTRLTTIQPLVDGRAISGVALPILTEDFDATLFLTSGHGEVFNGTPRFAVAYLAPAMQLWDDQNDLLTYYGITPNWNDFTALPFVTSTHHASDLDMIVYQHPSFIPDTSLDLLTQKSAALLATERTMLALDPHAPLQLQLLPTELAAAQSFGEGDFSYPGLITINYGHPRYLAALGGLEAVIWPILAHEYTHELFRLIESWFPGNPTCLNEGLADAVAFTVGALPESDFGPIGLRGSDFMLGCDGSTEIHDVGDCYFWHLHVAGVLTPEFLKGLFHPAQTFRFDSCTLNSQTGNNLWIAWAQAAPSINFIPLLDAMHLPHAATYELAKVQR